MGEPSLLDAQLIAVAFGVKPESGVAPNDVAERLLRYVPNELRAAEAVPAWR